MEETNNNKNEIIKTIEKVEQEIYNEPTIKVIGNFIRGINKNVDEKYTALETHSFGGYDYISDILTEEDIEAWLDNGGAYFIDGALGRGKTHLSINNVGNVAMKHDLKMCVLVSRSSLKDDVVEAIENKDLNDEEQAMKEDFIRSSIFDDDYTPEDKTKFSDICNVFTYQALEKSLEFHDDIDINKEERICRKIEEFESADIYILDEAHYFTHDSWNGGTEISYNFVKKQIDKSKLVICLSATSSLIIKKLVNDGLLKRENIFHFTADYRQYKSVTFYQGDYAIKVLDDLIKDIENGINRKAIVFFNDIATLMKYHEMYSKYCIIKISKNYKKPSGEPLTDEEKRYLKYCRNVTKAKLDRYCKDNNIEDTKAVADCLIDSKFPSQILFTTSVLEVGVNIKEEDLDTIIIESSDTLTGIQEFGRARKILEDGQFKNERKVNIYVKNWTYLELLKYSTQTARKYIAITDYENSTNKKSKLVSYSRKKDKSDLVYLDEHEGLKLSTTREAQVINDYAFDKHYIERNYRNLKDDLLEDEAIGEHEFIENFYNNLVSYFSNLKDKKLNQTNMDFYYINQAEKVTQCYKDENNKMKYKDMTFKELVSEFNSVNVENKDIQIKYFSNQATKHNTIKVELIDNYKAIDFDKRKFGDILWKDAPFLLNFLAESKLNQDKDIEIKTIVWCEMGYNSILTNFLSENVNRSFSRVDFLDIVRKIAKHKIDSHGKAINNTGEEVITALSIFLDSEDDKLTEQAINDYLQAEDNLSGGNLPYRIIYDDVNKEIKIRHLDVAKKEIEVRDTPKGQDLIETVLANMDIDFTFDIEYLCQKTGYKESSIFRYIVGETRQKLNRWDNGDGSYTKRDSSKDSYEAYKDNIRNTLNSFIDKRPKAENVANALNFKNKGRHTIKKLDGVIEQLKKLELLDEYNIVEEKETIKIDTNETYDNGRKKRPKEVTEKYWIISKIEPTESTSEEDTKLSE